MGTFDKKRGGAHVIPVKLPNLVFCGVFVTPVKRRNLRAFRQKRVKFGKKTSSFPVLSKQPGAFLFEKNRLVFERPAQNQRKSRHFSHSVHSHSPFCRAKASIFHSWALPGSPKSRKLRESPAPWVAGRVFIREKPSLSRAWVAKAPEIRKSPASLPYLGGPRLVKYVVSRPWVARGS